MRATTGMRRGVNGHGGPDTTEHLKLIQGAIDRMAGNSFLLKGWNVTVSAALFAIVAREGKPFFPVAFLYPAIAFWVLDAYYLRCERLYRKLYDAVRRGDPDLEPFTMDTKPFYGDVASWPRTMFALPVAGIHLAVVIVLVVSVVVGKGSGT